MGSGPQTGASSWWRQLPDARASPAALRREAYSVGRRRNSHTAMHTSL